MQPKISLIIPCFNVEDYLSECLDSVLSQNFDGLEIICVNDCATDKTSEILSEYEEKHAITVISHKINQGLGAARNTGIKQASGDYLCFLDSDDLLTENALITLYDLALATNADITSSQVQPFNEESGDLKTYPCFNGVNGIYLFNEYKSGILGKYYASACGRLYKRDFFNCYIQSYPIGVWYEDVIPFLKGQFNATILAVTQMKTIRYRIRSGSITSGKVKINDIKTYLNSAYDLFTDKFGTDRSHFLYFMVNTFAWYQDTPELRKFYNDKLTKYQYSDLELSYCPRLKLLRKIRNEKFKLADRVKVIRNSIKFKNSTI